MAEAGTSVEPKRFDWQRLLSGTVIAAVAAAIVNAVIYLIARGLDTIPREVLISGPAGDEPLGLIPVIFASIFGVLGAGVVFALCAKFSSRPVRLFQIISVVVLVLSFISPFTISGAPAKMILTLILMHIAVWAAAVSWLPRGHRSPA